MIIGKMINVIDSHTAGEPTRIIMDGIPHLPGDTIEEKAHYFRVNFDNIRTALFQEPRGLLRGEGAVITPPTNNEAQLGVFFMNAKSPLVPMCGHGSIGVITAAIEFGMIDAVEPMTKVVLDTPAGLVSGYAKVQGGMVESVSIRNIPSFLYKSIIVDLPNLSSVPMDIAYGGVYFTIIDASVIGTTVDLNNASRLLELAAVIKNITNSRISVNHSQESVPTISGVRFYSTLREDGTHIRNVTIVEGVIDRSPCGAGTSAHLAASYAKGQIGIGQEYIHESVVGTTFTSTIISTTKVDGFDAVIPEITGNAYTMGINTLILSPNDPLKHGFLI